MAIASAMPAIGRQMLLNFFRTVTTVTVLYNAIASRSHVLITSISEVKQNGDIGLDGDATLRQDANARDGGVKEVLWAASVEQAALCE